MNINFCYKGNNYSIPKFTGHIWILLLFIYLYDERATQEIFSNNYSESNLKFCAQV